jgi:magnesium transporter
MAKNLLKNYKNKKKNRKPGLSPGAVVFTGNQKVKDVTIHYTQYNKNDLQSTEFTNKSVPEFIRSSDDKVDWYDIRGLHDTEFIQQIGNTFNIHPLILEDIADIHQRPKFDEYESGIFIIIKALTFDQEARKVSTEQVSIFFLKGLVISFQEAVTDLFEGVRNRINTGSGRVRQRGSDYLSYALIDNIVDHYYVVLDGFEESIESLEDQLLNDLNDNIKQKIHSLKKELLIVRKSIFPLREAISRFAKCEDDQIDDRTKVFVRDVYDHTIQIMDTIDSYRDMLNGLEDLYLSELSYKMNQVMKILTLIATIFIPLTFLVGVYGMNFEYIPELHWRYSYFTLWGIMIILFVGLMYFFKRKKWF